MTNDARTITLLVNDSYIDVTVFAKRGAVLYGVCLTPLHSIGLVELIETHDGSIVLRTGKYITFTDMQCKENYQLRNNIQVTVSCFLGNAYLKEAFPELESRLCAKIMELISKIEAPQDYSF